MKMSTSMTERRLTTKTLQATLPEFLPQGLIDATRILSLNQGEHLFRKGDAARSVFFVLQGEVVAVRYLMDGAEAVMLRAAAGEFFAESTLVISQYSCDAICSRSSLLVEIPATALRHAFETQPGFALPFVAALAANSRRQCSRLERSRLKRARDRVLHYLVCESTPGATLSLAMPLSAWAVELGLEPETLYRTLRELEQEGLISRNHRAISLTPAPSQDQT
jgi:CRP-like cAMP-binding protein